MKSESVHRCTTGPLLCCPGCECESFEVAHAQLAARTPAQEVDRA